MNATKIIPINKSKMIFTYYDEEQDLIPRKPSKNLNLRNCIIFLFTITILYCNQPWVAQADTTANDDDVLDLIVPIIATIAKKNPWSIKSLWEQYAPLCRPTINGNSIAPYPSKGDSDCNDGDMTLFNGLLCASGDERGCDAVKRSQSPDGRFWRSPRRALTNNLGMGDNDDSASFSPDMAVGALLYIAKTKDKSALDKWLNWIDMNRSPLGPRYCIRPDPSKLDCYLRPPPYTDGQLLCDAARTLDMGSDADFLGCIANDSSGYIYFEARYSDHGFPLHLAGGKVLLMRLLGRGDPNWLDDAARELAGKEPQNPFFAYLKEGTTSRVRDLTFKLCPATVDDIRNSSLSQWAWERTDSEMAWKDSMLWDCIFMANLLTNTDLPPTPPSIDYFDCSPKYFFDEIICSFKINVTAEVAIKIFTSNGRLVLNQSDIVEGDQDIKWTLDTKNLASGPYIIAIYVGTDSRKVTKARVR